MIELKLKKSNSKVVDMGDNVSFKIDYPTASQEQKLQDILLSGSEIDNKNIIKYQQWFIKFTVKEIDGLDISEVLKGNSLLINNELNNDVWWALVSDISQTSKIYTKIDEELEYNNTDKKK